MMTRKSGSYFSGNHSIDLLEFTNLVSALSFMYHHYRSKDPRGEEERDTKNGLSRGQLEEQLLVFEGKPVDITLPNLSLYLPQHLRSTENASRDTHFSSNGCPLHVAPNTSFDIALFE